MANHREVTHLGFGSRIMNSIKGVFVGIILFLASFVILFVNEARTDLSKIAAESIPATISTISSLENNTFLSLTGSLSSQDVIGDKYLASGNYLGLSRFSEVYAWDEVTNQTSDKNVGGSETITTDYSYEKVWTGSPKNSNNFRITEGHENPSFSPLFRNVVASSADVNGVNFIPDNFRLPDYEPITLNSSNALPSDGFVLPSQQSEYLFKGRGNLSSPQIGDVRVGYSALKYPINEVTIFGKYTKNSNSLEIYNFDSGKEFARVFVGDRDSSLNTLSSEEKVLYWILIAVGFLAMWAGIALVFGPLATFLDIVPFLGSVGRGLIIILTGLFALILSSVTIIVSKILNSPIALIIAVLISIGLIVLYLRTRRNK